MHHRTKKRTHYGPVAHWIGKTLLRLWGWTFEGRRPEGVPKCVIIAVPHTTNWDLPVTLAASMALQIPAVFMMKDDWFRGALGRLFYWMGGVPVNRRERTSAVEQMVQAFDESDTLYMVIAPEGTRKHTTQWKLGFYYIALGAKVPVVPGFINHAAKHVGVGEPMAMTGDLDADFACFRRFYADRAGYLPEYAPPKSAPAPPGP